MGEILDLKTAKTLAQPPEWLIERYVRENQGDERLEVFHGVVSVNPVLHEVTCRLAEYLTQKLPDLHNPTRCLFNQCLSVATNEWIFGVTQTGDEGLRQSYFLRGLMAPLPAVLRQSVTVEEDDRIEWDPMQYPLAKWWNDQKRPIKVGPVRAMAYWQRITPIEFRTIVCARFLFQETKVFRSMTPYLDFIVDR